VTTTVISTPTEILTPTATLEVPTPTQTFPGIPTSTPTSIPADLDDNNQVDEQDVVVLIRALAIGEEMADLNGDGSSDFEDIFMFTISWKTSQDLVDPMANRQP